MMKRNLILYFSGVYAKIPKNAQDITYIDCTDIPGTDMYCTKEAEQEIKRRIGDGGRSDIDSLDSGN